MSSTTALIKSKCRRYPKDGETMGTETYIREYFRANTEKDRPPRAYKPQLSRRKVGFGDDARIVEDGVDHAKLYTSGAIPKK